MTTFNKNNGRPFKGPHCTKIINALPMSKSLRKLQKESDKVSSVFAEHRADGFVLDVSNLIHGDRIFLNKSSAIELAAWILVELNRKSQIKGLE